MQNYIVENKKWTDSIDVAFLYYELFNKGVFDLNYIFDTLNPAYIVIMHVPPSKVEEWTNRTEQLKIKFKNILFFKNSMDSTTIHFPLIEND